MKMIDDQGSDKQIWLESLTPEQRSVCTSENFRVQYFDAVCKDRVVSEIENKGGVVWKASTKHHVVEVVYYAPFRIR